MVYDFSEGAIQAMTADLPPQAGVPVPMDIIWGESGIIVRNTVVEGQNPAVFNESFLVYNPDGMLRATVPVTQNESRFMTNFVVLTYDQQEYIGVQYNTDEWDLFNPLTGESQPAPSVPELYVATLPEQSISLSIAPDGEHLEYQLLDLDGNPVGKPVDMGTSYEGHIGLSPDGRAVAFVQYDAQASGYDSAVTIWNNGEVRAHVEVNPLGFSFLWGPLAWRIRKQSSLLPH
jgi:hypothetical protein